MGLVARQLEAAGIATICLSSAMSITRAVNPPRAVFIDFPLGHTAGKPGDKALQRAIMMDTLDALETIAEPGTIRPLPYRWSDDDAWKQTAQRSDGDDRVSRTDEPQYQFPEDREAAEAVQED